MLWWLDTIPSWIGRRCGQHRHHRYVDMDLVWHMYRSSAVEMGTLTRHSRNSVRAPRSPCYIHTFRRSGSYIIAIAIEPITISHIIVSMCRLPHKSSSTSPRLWRNLVSIAWPSLSELNVCISPMASA